MTHSPQLAWSDLRSAAADLMRAYGAARVAEGVELVGEDPAAWAEAHEPALATSVEAAVAAYRELRPRWTPAAAEVFLAGVESLTLLDQERRPDEEVLRALSRWAAGTVHGRATKALRTIGRLLGELDGPTAERLVALAAGEEPAGELSVASDEDTRAWASEVVTRQMAWRFSADRLRDAIRRMASPPKDLGLELLRHRNRTDDDFRLLAETYASFQVRKEIVRFPQARADADVRAALGETTSELILKHLLWTEDVPTDERRAYFRRAARHHPEAAVRWLLTGEIEAAGLEPEDLLGPLQEADRELRQRAMFAAARLDTTPKPPAIDEDRPAPVRSR